MFLTIALYIHPSMKLIQLRIHLLTFYFLFNSMLSYSWTEHPLLTTPALSMHPVWSGLKPVEAKTLSTFLLAHEMEMEVFLAEQERWSREHLPNYYPRPEALAFRATGNREDVKARFLRAIRINPEAKFPFICITFQDRLSIQCALPIRRLSPP